MTPSTPPTDAAGAAPHILIVDDDREITELLRRYLAEHGYRVTGVPDGGRMWQALEEGVDLVVLDVMMPGEDGLVLCRKLREKSDVPVVMLTARGQESDRIAGLETGADDYLPKPFNPRELLARIRVILKRAGSTPGRAPRSGSYRYIRFAGWTLDLIARHLIDGSGVAVSLSGSEYKLLTVFLGNPEQVLDRDHLMEIMRGRESDPMDRSVDLMISRLRQRLKDDARAPAIIKTVRGEGYVLAVAVESRH